MQGTNVVDDDPAMNASATRRGAIPLERASFSCRLSSDVDTRRPMRGNPLTGSEHVPLAQS